MKRACDVYDKHFSHMKISCHLQIHTGEKPSLCKDNSGRGPVQKRPIMFQKKVPSRKYRPCYNVKVQGNIALTKNFIFFWSKRPVTTRLLARIIPAYDSVVNSLHMIRHIRFHTGETETYL